jgi:dCTP deaminase
MFWSGEELALRLPGLIFPYNPSQVDCASYRLCLGEQAFATSDRFSDGEPGVPAIQVLTPSRPNSTINIHPGQFAFLLTEESVEVPKDAIALISMRAGLKFKGLINVSGFHVDPGWKGRLVFGVYNAGPKMLMLERGQDLFLIVFASLDRTSAMTYPGTNNNRAGIKLEWAEGMAGQVFSPMALQRQMQEIQKIQSTLTTDLADIKGRGRTWDGVMVTLGIGFIGFLLAVILALFTSDFLKSVIGDWMNSAIALHLENVRKVASSLKPMTPTENVEPPKTVALPHTSTSPPKLLEHEKK